MSRSGDSRFLQRSVEHGRVPVGVRDQVQVVRDEDVATSRSVCAAAGETVLAPYVASGLLTRIRSEQPELTARELEIVELVAQGLSNREIGKALRLT